MGPMLHTVMINKKGKTHTQNVLFQIVCSDPVVDGNIKQTVFFFKVVYCSSVVQTRGIRFKL